MAGGSQLLPHNALPWERHIIIWKKNRQRTKQPNAENEQRIKEMLLRPREPALWPLHHQNPTEEKRQRDIRSNQASYALNELCSLPEYNYITNLVATSRRHRNKKPPNEGFSSKVCS